MGGDRLVLEEPVEIQDSYLGGPVPTFLWGSRRLSSSAQKTEGSYLNRHFLDPEGCRRFYVPGQQHPSRQETRVRAKTFRLRSPLPCSVFSPRVIHNTGASFTRGLRSSAPSGRPGIVSRAPLTRTARPHVPRLRVKTPACRDLRRVSAPERERELRRRRTWPGAPEGCRLLPNVCVYVKRLPTDPLGRRASRRNRCETWSWTGLQCVFSVFPSARRRRPVFIGDQS